MEHVIVELVGPHTHEGVDLQPGARIDVSKDTAHWLVLQRAGVVIEKHDDKE